MASLADPGRGGKQEVARARARAPRPHARPSVRGRRRQEKGVEMGWADWGGTGPAGGLHGWHQVSPSLSFISISVLFYFFLFLQFVFDLFKYQIIL